MQLNRLIPQNGSALYAKLEVANPGQSAKDRPARAMMQAAFAAGSLRAGGVVIESSSGNLGMALARECALAGVTFVCVVDVRANAAAVATMKAFGARIELVTEADAIDGDLLAARHARVRDLLATTPGAINLNQYANPANPAAHRDGTMRELAEALDHDIDVLLVATSTGGTIAGCQAYLREHAMTTRLVAVDAVGSVLFGGSAGPRLLPGMGAGVVTQLSTTVTPDEVIRVPELDSVAGCRALARREGVLAGASSGAVVAAAAQVARAGDEPLRIAMVLADGGAPYLPTVYDDGWVAEHLGASADDVRRRSDALFGSVPSSAEPSGTATSGMTSSGADSFGPQRATSA